MNSTRPHGAAARQVAGTTALSRLDAAFNRSYAHEMRELNPGCQEIVAEASKSVTYLGLWPTRGADDGSLRRNLTPDQVHLNGRDTANGDAHPADNRRMEPVTLSSAIGQRIGEITCPESTW
ncbi:hypothetical protein ACFT9I_01280 [Streptomyces sp. NPDC057137]|uniref:hypothetical protein n=1 Tax=Streptomyces sp. NPDC057137 TaxID=3346030 RepID=UPI003631F43A